MKTKFAAGKIKFNILFICMLLGMIMSGCTFNNSDKKNTQNTEKGTEEGMIDIFYADENKVVKSEKRYQLKQPDSVSNSIEEVMSCDVLPEEIKYNGFGLDEYGKVTVNLKLESNITEEMRILVEAALVSTLSQIEGVKSVEIIINSVKNEVVSDKIYDKDSFYFYETSENALVNKGNADLFLPSEDGESLKKVGVEVKLHAYDSVEKELINLLIEKGALPAEAYVKNICIKGEVCYVNMSSGFDKVNENVKSEVVVYSLVNTLTTLPSITYVQILIDGEKKDLYGGTVPIGELLQYKGGLLN